ncbi:MAG TPA: hypothetical protein VNL14_16095 [Candidatus Acidoferrales bacterium]|nr:hypothetical protein [Candidatus Acidoferrales bacterium]
MQRPPRCTLELRRHTPTHGDRCFKCAREARFLEQQSIYIVENFQTQCLVRELRMHSSWASGVPDVKKPNLPDFSRIFTLAREICLQGFSYTAFTSAGVPGNFVPLPTKKSRSFRASFALIFNCFEIATSMSVVRRNSPDGFVDGAGFSRG